MRFPGFEGEWAEYKVSDILEFFPTNSLSWDQLEYGTGDIFNLHYGLIHKGLPTQIELNKYTLPNIKGDFIPARYTLCKEGDVVFADASEDTNDIGKVVEFLNYDKKNVVCGLHTIHGRDKYDLTIEGFKGYAFSSKSFRSQIRKLAQGTKIYSISPKNFQECHIQIPDKEEQYKIVKLLCQIDDRISTQSKIIKELNVLKNTFIKRIFSGELRFKDTKGNDFPIWRNMKLGDIGEVKMCRRIFNHETSPIGDIPFFKIGSFGKKADAFISKELYEDYRKRFPFPNKRDILISAAGTVGRTVVYQGEDAYYQDSNIIWIDNDNTKVMNEFLYYILQIVKYNTEGGTIQRLYNNILKSTQFTCPSLPEQTKIVGFLSSIDSKIDIESQYLQKLEEQKKFLFQQIFV